MKMDVSGIPFNEIVDEEHGLIADLVVLTNVAPECFRVERWGSRAYLGWD